MTNSEAGHLAESDRKSNRELLDEAQQLQNELNDLSQRSHELSIQSEHAIDPDEKADLHRQAKEVMKQITEKNKIMRGKFKDIETNTPDIN